MTRNQLCSLARENCIYEWYNIEIAAEHEVHISIELAVHKSASHSPGYQVVRQHKAFMGQRTCRLRFVELVSISFYAKWTRQHAAPTLSLRQAVCSQPSSCKECAWH